MANPKGNPQTLKPYKPKWRSGKTQTIRVPIAIVEKVEEASRLIDEGETLVTEKEAKESLVKQNELLNSVTGDKELIIKAFKELVAVPSNRGGQVKVAAAKIAELLGLNLDKTSKGWIITDI